jgi:3-oxoacyl-[acyl-carrier protein] reductase
MPRAARTALITGSNKNIGRACALALAKGGFNIVVNGAQDRARAGWSMPRQSVSVAA